MKLRITISKYHTHFLSSLLEDYFSGSIFTIKRDLFIAQVFFTDSTTRKANEMDPSGVARTRIQVFGVIVIKGKDILVQVSGEFKVSKLELTE